MKRSPKLVKSYFDVLFLKFFIAPLQRLAIPLICDQRTRSCETNTHARVRLTHMFV
jgi:hypothetical protein